MKKILKLEIWGMVFISLFGSLLHFIFNWANRFWVVGAFSAVNESTWEHLKLAVIPAVLWAVLEKFGFKVNCPNFWFAKAKSIWLMPILIIVFFYGYKAILGTHNLILDISIFILSVIMGQIVSYKIMSGSRNFGKFSGLSVFFIILLSVLFFIFTFYPPHNFLFLDPVFGGYGWGGF